MKLRSLRPASGGNVTSHAQSFHLAKRGEGGHDDLMHEEEDPVERWDKVHRLHCTLQQRQIEDQARVARVAVAEAAAATERMNERMNTHQRRRNRLETFLREHSLYISTNTNASEDSPAFEFDVMVEAVLREFEGRDDLLWSLLLDKYGGANQYVNQRYTR